MSILYLVFIERVLGGVFEIGRFIDLAHMDILIAVVWIYNQKRWSYLKSKE